MNNALYLAAVVAIYFLPTVIAALRTHHDRAAIFLANLLLGWTGIGWIVALIWSATGTVRPSLPAVDAIAPLRSANISRPELRIPLIGETFSNSDGSNRQALIRDLRAGDVLTLEAEPGNAFDPRAVAVSAGASVVGYLPPEFEDVRAAVRAGRVYPARVCLVDRKPGGALSVVIGLTPPD